MTTRSNMTTKKFLETIEGSLWKEGYGPGIMTPNEKEERKNLYVKYHTRLKDKLGTLPDKMSLDGLTSLEIIDQYGSFYNYLISRSNDQIALDFERILTDIDTLIKSYWKRYHDEHTAFMQGIGYLNGRKRLNNIVFWILLVPFVLLSCAVIILAFLENLQIINGDNFFGEIISILDFACGAAFFIYERCDDVKKQKAQNKMQDIASGKDTTQKKDDDEIVMEGNETKGNNSPIMGMASRGKNDKRKIHMKDNKTEGDNSPIIGVDELPWDWINKQK